jgi:soluble lytic murein transglycosylase-like protein
MLGRGVLVGSLLALSLAARLAAADIYSFTDEKDVTHFTNVPADARFLVLLRSAPETSEAGARISPAMLARSAQYDEIIDAAATLTSVEPALLRAVIVVESAFDADAVSSKGARGLMQLMPATAKAYGAVDVDDPTQNVQAGARYLRYLINRYENDLELVLAAYNAGETAVERHGHRIPPFAETGRYVPRVLRVYNSLRELTIGT